MHRIRRWWWLILAAVPALFYAGLVAEAYIEPPLIIPGYSTDNTQPPTLVVEVENRGRWPATLQSVSVQGVLPPDETGAFITVGREQAQAYSLSRPGDIARQGELKGWPVHTQTANGYNGVKLVWYQTVDLRWLHCPTVRYRYLGWPMTIRYFCDDGLRGAITHGGMLPPELGDWGPWQSDGGGVRYRTQRVKQGQNEDLWIEVESARDVVLNRFTEEPAGGHARFRVRMAIDESRPGATVHYIVPLRWGEPTPEIQMEVIPVSQLPK